jgi:hypothetical protein
MTFAVSFGSPVFPLTLIFILFVFVFVFVFELVAPAGTLSLSIPNNLPTKLSFLKPSLTYQISEPNIRHINFLS